MELTKEKALELHAKMWSDMRDKLGDNPSMGERSLYKHNWIGKRFPFERILNDCFLCEYSLYNMGGICCLLKWVEDDAYLNTCESEDEDDLEDDTKRCDWRYSPISDILALPEK